MDEHALRALEYYKVREILTGYAASEPGRAVVEQLVPSADPAWVERSLKETEELRRLLDARRDFPIHGLKDISTALKKAGVQGAALRPEDLLAVQSVARTSRLVKACLMAAKAQSPLLNQRATALGVFEAVESGIARAIGDEGEVLDSASFELKRIRRTLSVVRSRINKALERIVQDPAYAKAVQEPVVTMRGDRYVIPLKPNYKMYLSGIVHDHSASHSTVFVEPEATVELNNKLVQLRVDERSEVERILLELTAVVRESKDGLEASLDALSGLDLIYAKASYAQAIGAEMPALKKGGGVELRSARHPLLIKVKGADTVPLDVKFGGEHTVIVITGPNTGGKTVALKTVGLLCLMAQAGMLIPASPDSVLSVFENIFSDIGDEQSVEQNLSTFSSHISQIVRILGKADKNTLVLLDELGAGTDPAEGAALGAAILGELHRRGCRVLVTTHHGALKVFAANTPGVTNASVEFDSETLGPTYRLLIGRPGRSSALLVAGRLGMPRQVIEAAERSRTGSDVQVDGLIERLEKESIAAREDRVRASAELVRAREERERLQELVRQADTDRREAVRKAKEKAAGIISSLRVKMREMDDAARRPVDKGVALAEAKKVGAEALALVNELRADEITEPARTVDISAIHAGDTVRVYRHNKLGKVLDVKRDKGLVVVQLDSMKVTLKADEIEPAAGAKAGPKKAVQVTVSRESEEGAGPGVEVNLIGMRVEEALDKLDKYLDDCLMSGVRSVRIIHGRGTGALRKAVAEALRGHRRVSSFRHATFEEGGDAITIAEFGE